MAENGKNRLAIFTIFRLRRTDVRLSSIGHTDIVNRVSLMRLVDDLAENN